MQNDPGNAHADVNGDLPRHTVSTLAYRASKAFSGAREDFADFHASEASRTPGEILAHMGDLFDWALSIVKGKQQRHDSPSLPRCCYHSTTAIWLPKLPTANSSMAAKISYCGAI
ncbi:MAG TPA: hypothetical protein VKT50_09790 [Candidatus Acidoferrales bacterium]|nr:hypothetical protein [Candidatus Acidoferrales bacterium]